MLVLVEPNGNSGVSHMRLGFADRDFAEMKDRSGENGAGVAIADARDSDGLPVASVPANIDNGRRSDQRIPRYEPR